MRATAAKLDGMTFIHFTERLPSAVILSVAKNLAARPFTSFRVTDLVTPYDCTTLYAVAVQVDKRAGEANGTQPQEGDYG